MSKKQKKILFRIDVVVVLFTILLILDLTIDLDSVIPGKFSWVLPASLYLVLYLIIAYDVLLKAIKNILRGQIFDENFLMCIASIGAFAISSYEEAVAVILLYQIGELFQSYAVGKSRKSISSLMDIKADYANVLRDNEIETVDPKVVKKGEVIVVKPGEKIPLDGIVISGNSTLDTKALTGEPAPKAIGCNEEVLSGCINLTQVLQIKVTKEYYDSTVARILDLVENASAKKSKAENFITKFAKYYTPIVVLSALALAVIPSLIWGDWLTWIYRALNFLVVSCPCALVISIPLTFFAGLGAASKKGILIKGSNYLEKLNSAKIFVFDKTGTLTKGNFVVKKVEPSAQEKEVLKLAAYAESFSNHPIAKSIIAAYGSKEYKDYQITEVAGRGVIARGSDVILCGNAKLLNDYNIDFTPLNSNDTVVYVAKDGEYVGSIEIGDELKEGTFEVLNELKQSGGHLVMLTGDNEEVAASVSSALKIEDYRSSLLPQDKVSTVEELLKNKNPKEQLCFVGDGINDAPVLMLADIGISMGAIGSAAAIEASDVVLMYDRLEDIVVAKRIAAKTMRIVVANIVFALTIKIVVLILSALGYSNMWLGVFADVGVAILAILNAMRAGKYKDK